MFWLRHYRCSIICNVNYSLNHDNSILYIMILVKTILSSALYNFIYQTIINITFYNFYIFHTFSWFIVLHFFLVPNKNKKILPHTPPFALFLFSDKSRSCAKWTYPVIILIRSWSPINDFGHYTKASEYYTNGRYWVDSWSGG